MPPTLPPTLHSLVEFFGATTATHGPSSAESDRRSFLLEAASSSFWGVVVLLGAKSGVWGPGRRRRGLATWRPVLVL